jgi:tetratricopeptide (TPR) repeat protein
VRFAFAQENWVKRFTWLYALKWFIVMAFVWGAIFIFSTAFRATYSELEAKLATAQYASPDRALKLAEKLMQDHPSQCLPYQIAANLHSLNKDYGAAETVLQSAIDKCAAPPELYVRLAHFYQRVMPEKLKEKILKMLKHPEVERSPILAAKLKCVAGLRAEAIQDLEKESRKLSASFEVFILLSRLYSDQGKSGKARRLLMDMPKNLTLDQAQKAKLLKAMFALQAPLDRPQTDFCLNLILQMPKSATGYADCRRKLSENLEKLMSLDHEKHAVALLQEGLGRKIDQDLRVWLSAIYLQKIERPKDAFAMLKDYETIDARLLEEKARLSAHTRDIKQIKECWQDLLEIMPKDVGNRLAYSQILNNSELKVQSRSAIAGIEPIDVPETLRRTYFSLRFDNDAALKNYNSLVDIWIQAGKYYAYNDFLIFKDIIFSQLPETAQHRRLFKALEAEPSDQVSTCASIDLLRLFVAEQLRDTDLYLSSADAYLSQKLAQESTQQPAIDTKAINAFVRFAIDQAITLFLMKKDVKAESFSKRPAVKFAAKWSAFLVDQYPDKPTYQANLFISDYISGRISDLQERCQDFLRGNENNHRQLQLIAETLSRIGCYQPSADYYQKAIALRPTNIKYHIGYAACLSNLNRYDQARQIYTRLLIQPTTAQSWNIKNLLQHLWFCYEKLQITDDFDAFIDRAKKQPTIDAEAIVEAAAAIFFEKGRFQDAEKRLTEFIENSPEDESRYAAYLKLANCHVYQNEYNEAIRIYTTCLRIYPGDSLKTIDCLYNRAEIKRKKGNYQAAIADWQHIAERFPDDEVAAESLLAAASVAHEILLDLPQAKHLYQSYLDLEKKDDLEMVGMVEKKLAAIDKQEIDKQE